MPQPAGRDTTDTKNSPAARRRCQNAQRRVAMKKKKNDAQRRVEKKYQKNPGGGTTSADRRLDKTKIERRVGTAAPRTSASGPVRDQHPSRPTPPPETPGAGRPTPPPETPGAGLRCNCMEQRCGAEFLMSAAAVASYTKKGWPMRKRCYACTAAKKVRAKQRKQQRRKPGTPTPAPAAAGAPPQPPADVVSESGGTWRAEAAGAVAAVHAADHGVADVSVAPGDDRLDPGFLAKREQVMGDLIDLAKYGLDGHGTGDVFSLATWVTFEERGLTCTKSAEDAMAGRRTLWEAVCSQRQKHAEQVFNGLDLAFEHVDNGLFSGLFSLDAIPGYR